MLSATLPGLVAPPSYASAGVLAVLGVSLRAPAPAVAVDPGGGCWRYVPAPGADVGEPADPAAITDVSAALEPWSAATPAVSLSTAGGTAVGRARSFVLAIPGGPVLVPSLAADLPATTATVTALLAYDGTPLEPVEVEVELPAAAAGDAVALGAVELTGSLPIAAAGASSLVLRSLHVDLPDLALRIDCNGQVEGTPAGVNPATAPVETAVVATFDAAASSAVAVTAVAGQPSTAAARAGDTVRLAGTGFDGLGEAEVMLCPIGAGEDDVAGDCVAAGSVTADEAGAWSTGVTLPEAADLADVVGDRATEGGGGPIALRIAPAAVEDPAAPEPLAPIIVRVRFLGEPTLAVTDEEKGRRPIRVAATDLDPGRSVRLRALDAGGEPVGRAVRATPGARGGVRIRMPRPEGATEVRATQWRRGGPLVVAADLPTAEVADEPAPTLPPVPGAPAVAPPAVAEPAATAVAPPADIPEPEPMPIDEVAAPVDPESVPVEEGAVVVTAAELVGSATLADLFGASPRRILRLTVENVGDGVVTAPGLEIAVGRTGDVEPIYSAAGLGSIAPGETQQVEVPIALGVGAIGTYQIDGRLGAGDAGSFSLTWQTYPWGLIGLNLAGVVLLVWAVNRRLSRRSSPVLASALAAPAATAAGGVGAASGVPTRTDDAVVDLETLERWWALQAVPGGLAAAVAAGGTSVAPVPAPQEPGGAVVDVEAVERWLAGLPARPSGGDRGAEQDPRL
ncbi:hypothetical protein E8D34_07110 [Nocardioides sp. GY 10113]|uniref:hypothetical protein n=1 Tax=Nocardioides sp. GY 10113 TaxID=2569761 RepID=UPI0010A8E469|nr:hypothetical protein [Nocardioides sp. GY 10113]TIC88050.1 hypothetical protein E8D34_07110 [Nocardioides sp. GY 10113]